MSAVSGTWQRAPQHPAPHQCRLPMRDVMAQSSFDTSLVKVGVTPDGVHGDRWLCACGRVYEIGWLKGHEYPSGRPVYGKPGTRLYLNVLDNGWAWREVGLFAAWRARRREAKR